MDAATAASGMEYGGITPIGLPADWPILIDEAVVAADRVVIGSGLAGMTAANILARAGRSVLLVEQHANTEKRDLRDVDQLDYVRVVHRDRGRLTPRRGTLDVSKARSLLGYRPRHDLTHGFERYWEFYVSQKDHYDRQRDMLDCVSPEFIA